MTPFIRNSTITSSTIFGVGVVVVSVGQGRMPCPRMPEHLKIMFRAADATMVRKNFHGKIRYLTIFEWSSLILVQCWFTSSRTNRPSKRWCYVCEVGLWRRTPNDWFCWLSVRKLVSFDQSSIWHLHKYKWPVYILKLFQVCAYGVTIATGFFFLCIWDSLTVMGRLLTRIPIT